MAMKMDEGREVYGIGEYGEEDTLLTALYTGWLTKEELPYGAILVDARNGFREMIRLAMLWTVRH